MRHSRDEIIKRLDNTRIESDGSAIADCPACATDGKGIGKLYVYADGTTVCQRYRGISSEEHHKHIKQVFTAIGLAAPVSSFIKESLFNDRLTLELSPSERGRVQVTARN